MRVRLPGPVETVARSPGIEMSKALPVRPVPERPFTGPAGSAETVKGYRQHRTRHQGADIPSGKPEVVAEHGNDFGVSVAQPRKMRRK